MNHFISYVHNTIKLFKQQRLPAWQPLLTPWSAAWWLIAVALLFFPIGTGVWYLNSTVADVTVRYDTINSCKSSALNPGGTVEFKDAEGTTLWRTGCATEVTFRIDKTMQAPVYLYYGLTNFYQNHRRFSNSKNDAQLMGKPVSGPGALSGASPLAYPGELHHNEKQGITVGKRTYAYEDCMYAPAGLIPWSMFNDSFTLYRMDGGDNGIPKRLICNGSAFSKFTNEGLVGSGSCHKRGIAWEADASVKFKPPHFPPEGDEGRHPVWSAPRHLYPHKDASQVTPPSNDIFFTNGWYAGEVGHEIPSTLDEDLMVWTRVASLPKFRKLYRVIDVTLEPGTYLMHIDERYDVSSFGGQKSFSLTTVSLIGGPSPVMAYLYLGLGVFYAVSGVILLRLQSAYSDRAFNALGKLLRS